MLKNFEFLIKINHINIKPRFLSYKQAIDIHGAK